MLIHGKQMHLQCTAEDIGRYVVLPAIRGAARSLRSFWTMRRKSRTIGNFMCIRDI